jgi:acetyltransferase-like isoleucine patch superfamily enzyme
MASLVRRAIVPIWQRVYRLYAVRRNVTIGKRVHIGVGTTLWAPRGLRVGDNVYIGKRCTIECDGTIGSNVLIANDCGLIGRYDHDFSQVGVTMRDAPWIGHPSYRGPGAGLVVEIGDDVWLGFRSVILTGVRVGRGALVAAGSVVCRNVEPYAVVAGVPARPVGSRFSPAQVIEHEKLLSVFTTPNGRTP